MKLARLAAALLPLAGLAALWAWSEHISRQGTDWEVSVAGYDPRDLLRGHYVEFTYDWPSRDDERQEEGPPRIQPPPEALCLSGDPPLITQAAAFDPLDRAVFEACAHPILADPGGVYGAAGLRTGRLYVGQDRARAIEERLAARDLRAIVTIRQRKDGTFTPVDIRFRPLTEAEREAREGDSIRPAAPPIMTRPEPDRNE